MRVEGTYTFAATIDRVFGSLMDADALEYALPHCERMIQLGPEDADGRVRFEARLRSDAPAHATTVTVTAKATRRPSHLSLALHGFGAIGTFEGKGRLDLVAQDHHTVVAYVWDVATPSDTPSEQQALVTASRRFAQSFCERLGALLIAETESAPLAEGQPEIIEASALRDRIVALRQRAPTLAFQASVWTQRALWMGTGFVLGVGAIGLTLNALRRISERERD